jgi:PAS domain S-box-containing protein
MIASIVLVLSILIQFAAAFRALRLMRLTGRQRAWTLIALGLSLMALRRLITLLDSLSLTQPKPPDLEAELIGLVISVVMLLGVGAIRPLFAQMRQTTQALQDSEKRFRASFEQAALGICHVDTEGRYLSANPWLCAMLGYTAAELTGLTFQQITYPPDLQANLGLMERMLAGELSTTTFEKRYVHKNGDLIDVSVTVSLVRKASGEPDYIVAVVEDIRPRKQAEEARRQADERLRIAIQGFPILAFAQDAGLRYTWAFSPRYGDLAQSYVGRLDSDLLPPEVAGPLMALKQAVLDSGQALRREMPASGLQGVADHDLVIEPQCDAEGRVIGIIGAAMDITERRLAERQALDLAVARQKVQVLREFISDASHDLRTPLTALKNSLYLMERIEDPARQAYYFGMIKYQAGYLEALLENMLMLSRLDQPSATEIAPIDVHAVLQSVVNRLRPMSDLKHIQMMLDLADDLPAIEADWDGLDRLLANLLDNALRYTSAERTVTVSTRAEGERVILRVSDQGPGIQPGDLPHIFDRFFRTDMARTMEPGGTGLGLAITKKIVELHGGSISVESVVDQGSTFTVCLPVRQGHLAGEASAA